MVMEIGVNFATFYINFQISKFSIKTVKSIKMKIYYYEDNATQNSLITVWIKVNAYHLLTSNLGFPFLKKENQ